MAASIDGPRSMASEHLLTCPICIEQFVDPKSLRCLHTFCTECLQRLQDRQVIVCPLCKMKTPLSPQGVRGLPSDFRIDQMRDILNESCSERSFCDVCRGKETKSADYHCATCSVFYCRVCVQKHNQNPVLQSHTVVRLSVEKTKSTPLCPKHLSRLVTFVCLECKPRLTLCAICILDHDKSHDLIDIGSARTVIRKQLKGGLDKVKAGSRLIRQHLQQADKIRNQYEEALTLAQEGISKQAAALIGEVQKEESRMLKEAQDKVEAILSRYNQEGAKSQLVQVESLREELEHVLSASDTECISLHQHLSEEVKHMRQFTIPAIPQVDIKFAPSPAVNIPIVLGKLKNCQLLEGERLGHRVPSLSDTPRSNLQQQASPVDLSTCEGCNEEEKYPLVMMYCLQRKCLERLCSRCRLKHDTDGHATVTAEDGISLTT